MKLLNVNSVLIIKKFLILFFWLGLNAMALLIHFKYFNYLYLFILPIHSIVQFLHLLNIILHNIKRKIFKKEEIIFDNYANNKVSFTITCYTESVNEIYRTIESLSKSIINSKKNCIIFVIYDGMSIEKDTDKYTWQLIIEKMKIIKIIKNIDYNENWKRKPNKIDIILCEYNDIIIINIIKHKNLGKTDSLSFVRDLLTNRLNNNLTDLLTNEIKECNFDISDIFYCGSLDADCMLDGDSVEKLYNDISKTDIIGVSGIVYPTETKLGFWNIYQFSEYFSSQLLTRLSMSIVGNVNCLPGAFNIFDLHAYTSEVRTDFLLYPDKRNIFKTLAVLVGEDRRFTGLSLYHNPNKKTIINTSVMIYTTVPNSLRKMISQRRRWLTASFINDYYDMIGKNIKLIVRLDAFSNLISLCFYIYVYTILIYFFMDVLPYYARNQPFVYFISLIVIIIFFVGYKIALILIFLKKIKIKVIYIFGEIFLITTSHFFVLFMIFKCILSIDNLGWGNVHQNNMKDEIEVIDKIEVRIDEKNDT